MDEVLNNLKRKGTSNDYEDDEEEDYHKNNNHKKEMKILKRYEKIMPNKMNQETRKG